MVDDEWQHRHFNTSGTKVVKRGSRGGMIVVGLIIVVLGAGGLGLSEWLGYTDLGLRAWIASLFPGPEPEPAAAPDKEPAQPAVGALVVDVGPRLRQLEAIIAQQQRGIDLMQRESAEASRGEDLANREGDAAAARVSSMESYLASTRLTARQLADARGALAAAKADLNNARRRAKELGDKRQSLTARIAKAVTTRDDARRESERLTTPMPDAPPH